MQNEMSKNQVVKSQIDLDKEAARQQTALRARDLRSTWAKQEGEKNIK